MFKRNYLYERTTIVTDVKGAKCKTTGRVEKDKGWREISLEKRNRRDKILPNITKDEEVSSLLEVDERWTSPPKPYTEGQLITAMETAGKLVESEKIGRAHV